MLNKPTNTIDWNALSTNTIEPSTPKKGDAWNVNEVPPMQYLNWCWNLNTEWTQFLNENIGCYNQVETVLGSKTLLDGDNLGTILFNIGGSVSLNLPVAADNKDRLVIAKKLLEAAEVTILPNGIDTINGLTDYTLDDQEGSGVILVSDGISNWNIIFDSFLNGHETVIELPEGSAHAKKYLHVEREVTTQKSKVRINRLVQNILSFVPTQLANMSVAVKFQASSGTSGAALVFGGMLSSSSISDDTQKFNKLSWVSGSSMNMVTGRKELAGCGVVNASLSFGGSTGSAVSLAESFNGATWASAPDLSYITRDLGGCGSQNAALATGGFDSVTITNTAKFNGYQWGSNNPLNTAVREHCTIGSQNAALNIGGGYQLGATSKACEQYNGAAWYQAADLTIYRRGAGAAGVVNAAVVFYGMYSGILVQTVERFNGNSWSLTQAYDGAAQRAWGSGNGSSSSAVYTGGLDGASVKDLAERYDGIFAYDVRTIFVGDDITFETKDMEVLLPQPGSITIDIDYNGYSKDVEKPYLNDIGKLFFSGYLWRASGNTQTNRLMSAGVGTQDAALNIAGGTTTAGTAGTLVDITEKFNGSTWTSLTGSEIQTSRVGAGAVGTVNSALCFGGQNSSGNVLITEEFNGTNWSTISGGDLPGTGHVNTASAGVRNAALCFGGSADTDTFTGLVWSTPSAGLAMSRRYLSGCGTVNAALAIGGLISTMNETPTTEKYNGNAWSLSAALNTGRMDASASGFQNNAISMGGQSVTASASLTSVEKFNGIVWYIIMGLSDKRFYHTSSGNSSAATVFSGQTSGPTFTLVTEQLKLVVTASGTANQEICEKLLII